MPRPMTKNDLMATAKENYEKLNEFISNSNTIFNYLLKTSYMPI